MLLRIIPKEVTDCLFKDIDYSLLHPAEEEEPPKSKKGKVNNEYSHIQSEDSHPEFEASEADKVEEPNQQMLVPHEVKAIKSIEKELTLHDAQGSKNLNKVEIKAFENLHKAMRNEDEWILFCKMFLLYFDGVINLASFSSQFEDKFGSFLKQEVKQEIAEVLQSRDTSRRTFSDILRPWNDLENQEFSKVPNSSYFKMHETFPLPICSQKINPKHGGHYLKILNDRYLSLATGSESYQFKVKNINEDMIFKNEDDMYKMDQQIDLYERCLSIVQKEIAYFQGLDSVEKEKYHFPAKKLRPMICYMEDKHRYILEGLIENKKFNLDLLNKLRSGFEGQLVMVQNYRIEHIEQFKDIFRKNFTKSLDHRSFQYKDFIKKFLTKQPHIQALKAVAQKNQTDQPRPVNMLKGGNFKESPFFHTIGPFVNYDFASFDMAKDAKRQFPIDMSYSNFEDIADGNQ
mmetsp:Transcript_28671/g.43291  ORF Transcript_28671/g.43291 Transcript_28671/m.43291 type:complete len:459 (+) Transcript_28671:1713-3089(+)